MTVARTQLFLATLALAGCDVFDPHLYLQPPGDLATPSDALSGGRADLLSSADAMPRFDGGAASPCGHGGAATACSADYLFCDGFEDESGSTFFKWTQGLVDNYDGMAANAGTALAIADTPVCLGQHAMHAVAYGGQQQAFVFVDVNARPNPLYVRVYFYVTQYSQPFEILGFHAPNGQFSTLNVDPGSSTFSFSTNFSTAAATFPGAVVPRNRWLCLELITRFDANNGEVQLLLDGKQLGDLAGVSTEPAGATQSTVNVGVIATNSGETGINELYVDEVALSAHPIGCL